MPHETRKEVLPGRVTALKTSDSAVTAIAGAQSAIEAFRNRKEIRELAEKEGASLSPVFRKLLVATFSANEDGSLDDLRKNTCVAVMGIRGHIAESIAKYDKEMFLTKSPEECNEMLQETSELFKKFASYFPVMQK